LTKEDGTAMTTGNDGRVRNYAYDPELAAALELIPAISIEDIEAARVEAGAFFAAREGELDQIEDLEISEQVIAGSAGGPDVRVRVFAPIAYDSALPALLHIHSGGFVLGSIEDEHALLAAVALDAGAVVVTVDYRLAPEHPYPAALDDCYAALCWMAENADRLGIDLDRVGIAGASAGGALAAGVALLARDRRGPRLCFQLLNQPVLDDRLETASMKRFVDTPVWHATNAALSWRYYLGESPGDVPCYAAPLRADDLSGLPPAYIATAEFDPLRDEGILYALRLLEAGVSVELHNFSGTFHGSEQVETAEVSQRQIAEILHALRRGLRSSFGSLDRMGAPFE
jgi:acetyl esterase/lipase